MHLKTRLKIQKEKYGYQSSISVDTVFAVITIF